MFVLYVTVILYLQFRELKAERTDAEKLSISSARGFIMLTYATEITGIEKKTLKRVFSGPKYVS